MKHVLFSLFYVTFGVQRLMQFLAGLCHRCSAQALRGAQAFWHWKTALISSVVDAVTHGGQHAKELEKRNVEYLGYVGFASYASSLALFILSAGPVGRYLTWLWVVRLRPLFRRGIS